MYIKNKQNILKLQLRKHSIRTNKASYSSKFIGNERRPLRIKLSTCRNEYPSRSIKYRFYSVDDDDENSFNNKRFLSFHYTLSSRVVFIEPKTSVYSIESGNRAIVLDDVAYRVPPLFVVERCQLSNSQTKPQKDDMKYKHKMYIPTLSSIMRALPADQT